MIGGISVILGVIWLCVVVAMPRRPALARNEVAWLVYSRQYGAWHRLLIAAIIATLIAVLGGLTILIHDVNSDLFRLRNACFVMPQAVTVLASRDTCWSLDDNNHWSLRSVGD